MEAEKRILVTGANRGLGKAISEKLAHDGYSLILHAREESSLNETLKGIANKQRHLVCCADFSNNESLKSFTSEIKKKYGSQLFGIVNNAGIALDKPIAYQPEKDIDQMIQVNLKAPVMIGKMAMKLFMLKKEGVIINISSCVGETGNAFQSVYAATKAGLNAASKSWAKEAGLLLENQSIRVVSVSPGFIETDMTDKIPEEFRQKYKANIPLGRYGLANEVANAVGFLFSENASYINGTELKVNGGIL